MEWRECGHSGLTSTVHGPVSSQSSACWYSSRLGDLPQLVAAACQVGGFGDVARQLDGFVVRRARLLTAAQPAQQLGAGRMA